jgi:UDP-N-acetylglucosamine 2-epimerase (non-hydrolysing)
VKVLSVVGARPQFVKLGAVSRAFSEAGDIDHVIVHTGQHYDPAMSDIFFADLGIPAPHIDLGVGSGTQAVQTAAMLSGLEAALAEHQPNWTVVYGDTNSTIAGALAAVKLHLPVAHLEAGLRSFNRRMPEEHNRVLTDHAADLLLAPSEVAIGHLAREGLASRAIQVGDVMTDVCFNMLDSMKDCPVELPDLLDPSNPYLVATIHRADNTDSPTRLRQIIGALGDLHVPVVLVAHPRLMTRASSFGIELTGGSLHCISPMPYPKMLRAVAASAGVITDSGGLQKEAFLLGAPCTTLRAETEWVETLQNGWNVLVSDLRQLARVAARSAPTAPRSNPYGEGKAAGRVVTALRESGPT